MSLVLHKNMCYNVEDTHKQSDGQFTPTLAAIQVWSISQPVNY